MSTNTNISLLLTETDPIAMEICRKVIALRFPELAIHAVTDPDEALKLVQEHKHDIVVSDVFIPKNKGINLARDACAENPNTYVLFLTGDHSLNKHILEPYAKELCIHRIVSKPLDVDELVQAIAAAVTSITLSQAPP